MHGISAVIITKNEETNITRCLDSVSWADEILVLDSGSTDRTLEICAKYEHCRILQTEWLGFGKTKQKAVELAQHDLILSLDADEQITLDLQREIQKLTQEDFSKYIFRIKRNSFYLGRRIRFCGWQNDRPVKLFDRKFARFNEKTVHESVVSRLPKKDLIYMMNHYTYPTRAIHFQKMISYGDLGAEVLFQKRKSSSLTDAFLRAGFKFVKMYFLRLGFLDGWTGLKLCLNSAWGVYYKYKKLCELNK